MRAVIQRVSSASVTCDDYKYSKIERGLLVLLAVHKNDTEELTPKMAEKILGLRIFEDKNGKMNLSLKDVGAEILVVSQFTLYGDVSRGKRPSFIESARPEKAVLIYQKFIKYIRDQGISVGSGSFGSYMSVELVNDGPTTIIIDL